MRWKTTVTLLAATTVLGASAATTPAAVRRPKAIRLSEAWMIVEVNATDGDAGLQIFLDGEAWRSMTLTAPNGRRVLAVNTRSTLREHGLTELFSESSEPPFEELPLRKFKRLFPEGRYRFRGTTIEGRPLVGRARLSHDLPKGPKIVAPGEGSTVSPDAVVADWDPVPETKRVNIIGYRAVVEREDPLRVFSVDLPASVTSVTVPAEFIESGTPYKLEVQAIEAGGNQTVTEIEFRVA
jgi:hypothetical protein